MQSATVVFVRPELNEQFAELGFAVLSAVETGIVHRLETLFRATDGQQANRQGWYNSSHDKSLEENLAISTEICSAIQAGIGSHLPSYRAVVGAFLVKRGNTNGVVIPHADWAMMDETLGVSVSAFVPLCDLDETTGWIQVVPGSHKLVELNRGHAPGRTVGWAQLTDLMVAHAFPVKLKRGQVLLFDHRMVHFSPSPTVPDVERIVANCSFLPHSHAGSHFSECLQDQWGGVFREYEVDDAFYMDPQRRLHPAGFYPLRGYRRQPAAERNLEVAPGILSRALEIARKAYIHPA